MKKIRNIVLWMLLSCTAGFGQQIISGEYFIDTDPGPGSGTALSVTAGDTITDNVTFPAGTFGLGFHRIYLRYLSNTRAWGIAEGRLFYIYDTAAPTAPAISLNVSSGEYFFDTDPGVGLATPVPAFTASDSFQQSITISTVGLGVGFHRMYTRYHDASGKWGIAEDRLFYVYDTVTPVPVIQPDIVAGEYFIDNDPGPGLGTFITVNPATDSLQQTVTISASGLTLGTHYAYIRYKDVNGKWGLAQPIEFQVCLPPAATITSVGDTSFCAGGSVTLKADTGTKFHYQWLDNGAAISGDTSGTLTVHDTSAQFAVIVTDSGGCSATSNSITVTVNQRAATSTAQSVCQGQSYSFGGRNLTTAGVYKDTLQTTAGCDSIITLTLSLLQPSSSSFSQQICTGSTYNFNGKILNSAGTYKDTVTGSNTCDSIVTLTLTLSSYLTTSLDTSICQGNSYSFNGRSLDTAGVYKDTLRTGAGCDSIVTLTLSIIPPSRISISKQICTGGSYDFNGRILDTAGVFVDTLTGTNTCDSIVILTLTVSSYLTSTLDTAICRGDTLTFNGQSLTLSGPYSDTLTGSGGCDSIATVNLSVDPGPVVAFTGLPDTICSSASSIVLSGGTPSGGTYSGLGVNDGDFVPSSATPGNDSIIYAYTDSVGCSNKAVDVIDVTVCTGIEEVNAFNFTVFPNPTEGLLHIRGNGPGGVVYFEVEDVLGRKLQEQQSATNNKMVDETLNLNNLPSGFYFLTVKTDAGTVLSRLITKD